MDRGRLRRVAGHGKPLEDGDRPRDELWWVRDKLRREGAQFLPPMPTLRREVELVGDLDRIWTPAPSWPNRSKKCSCNTHVAVELPGCDLRLGDSHCETRTAQTWRFGRQRAAWSRLPLCQQAYSRTVRRSSVPPSSVEASGNG